MNNEDKRVSPQFTVGVLGPGAVGGLLAAVLGQTGDPVITVARPATAELIAQRGISLESVRYGDFIARPRAMERLDAPVDLLFITVKAPDLAASLERVPADLLGPGAVVAPLLNGLEHLTRLRERYGPRVAAGSISAEAKYLGPGRVAHTTPFALIRLASDSDVPAARLAQVAEFLNRAGLKTEIAPSEADVVWAKLVRLNALACLTAASGLTLGGVLAEPFWQDRLAGAVSEAAAVARAEGYEVSTEEVLVQLAQLPASLGTSLQRDLEAGRPLELDAIAGAVVRRGQRHGLACKVIQGLIRDIEARAAEFRPA
ncbi:MAG: 2-dehydropantoate 2-reductase [Deltaproteobacteria bacterium]|nr:2-dehydropantoate 2-reductase [Deltaproteobacteria bacterium]